MTDSTTYAGAWSKTVSPESEWLVQSVVAVSPIVSCLASSIVLTDILGLVLLKLGVPASVYGNRNLVIGILSTCVLFPLCILKDLSALKSVSVLGVAGHLVAMGALSLRVRDKSYFAGGQYFTAPVAAATAVAGAAKASVAKVGFVGLSKWFVLASLLSYCFVTHYNVSRRITSYHITSCCTISRLVLYLYLCCLYFSCLFVFCFVLISIVLCALETSIAVNF